MADNDTTKSTAKPPTKAAFVRSLSKDTPAAEVVAKAKAAGLTLSPAHVHAIRSEAKASRKKKRAAKKPAGKAPSAATKKTAAPKKSAAKAAKKASKKAATKPATQAKAASGAAFTSKKAFVESMPRTTPAKDVIAAGKKAGIALSTGYIYVLRSKSGAQGTTKRGPGRPKGSKNKAPTAKAAVAATGSKSTGGSSIASVLRRLVLDHGRNRVRDELAKVESSVAKLLGNG